MNEQLTKRFTAYSAGGDGETNWRNSERCAEIAQEHAQNMAIDFYNWRLENEYEIDVRGERNHTDIELYKIFIKEKEGK